MKKRLHFGVILSTVDQPIQNKIWRSVARYAANNDINLTAYFGSYQATYHGTIREHRKEAGLHFDTCFESIKYSQLDGLLIFSGFIVQSIGLNKFEEYIAEIPEHLPVVSISYPLPDKISVLVGNIAGMYDAVNHLIKYHKKRNIAFIRGPDKHIEAEERFDGYKQALYDNGIIYDKNYVFPGNFSRDSGVEAVREMIERRNLFVDAIVACDDETAFGVMSELKSRDILIPADIALVGFDDEEISEFLNPSLSTVRQDFSKLGEVSTEALCNTVKGESIEAVITVNSEFIARRSCGCGSRSLLYEDMLNMSEIAAAKSLTSFLESFTYPLFDIIFDNHSYDSWILSVIEIIKKEPYSGDKFLDSFIEMLNRDKNCSSNYNIWRDILGIIKIGVNYFVVSKYKDQILQSIITALTFVQEMRYKEAQLKTMDENYLRIIVRGSSSALMSSLSLGLLEENLHGELVGLSIDTALIGLYQTPVKSNNLKAPREIKTIIGYDGSTKFNINYDILNSKMFYNYSVIEGLEFDKHQRMMFYMPLSFNEEEMGILLLSYNEDLPIDIYETIRLSISTALKGTTLLQTHQMLSVTDELTGILNRRGFLQFADSRLHSMSREDNTIPVIIMIDMDDLKFINDTFGHKEGDIAIITFTGILKKVLRKSDVIGRMGGDEFAVLTSVKAIDDYKNVEERIRKEIDEYNNLKLHPYEISGSFGCTILESSTMINLTDAIMLADKILYDEKEAKKVKTLKLLRGRALNRHNYS